MTKERFIEILTSEGWPGDLAEKLWDMRPVDPHDEALVRLVARAVRPTEAAPKYDC